MAGGEVRPLRPCRRLGWTHNDVDECQALQGNAEPAGHPVRDEGEPDGPRAAAAGALARSKTSTARSARPAPAASARSCTTAPPTPTARSTWGTCSTRCSRTSSSARSRCGAIDSPYVPGWDCHGLPIEHKVVKDLGSKAAGMGVSEIRDLCHAEALKWVDLQRDQFRRLGVMGDWDNPYLTLDPRYEAGILDVLADLLERGLDLPPAQADPLVPHRSDRAGRGRARIPRRDVAEHLRQLPHRLGRPRVVGRRPLARDDLDDDPVDPPGQRRDRRPPRPPLRGGPLRRSRARARPSTRSWRPTWSPRSWRSAGSPTSPRWAACRGADLEQARVPPSLHRPREPDRPGRLRQRRGRHGPGPHRPRPRDRGLRDRPDVRPADPEPGRRLGPLHRARPPPSSWARTSSRPTRSSSRPCGSRASSITSSRSPTATRTAGGARSRSSSAPPSSGSSAVDHADLRAKTLEAIADDVRWFPVVGAVADRGDGLAPARLVHQPAAVVGRADPRPRLQRLRRRQLLTAESVRHFRDLFRREGADAWYREAGRGAAPPGRDSCPKCGGTDFRKEDGHPRRLVRVGLQPSLGPGGRLRPRATRPTCTSKAPTSTAAGSSRRS